MSTGRQRTMDALIRAALDRGETVYVVTSDGGEIRYPDGTVQEVENVRAPAKTPLHVRMWDLDGGGIAMPMVPDRSKVRASQ